MQNDQNKALTYLKKNYLSFQIDLECIIEFGLCKIDKIKLPLEGNEKALN